MLIVKLGKKENINQALKRLKKKVKNVGLLKECRKRQAFMKPSAVKRKKKQTAIYNKKFNTEL